MIAPGAFHPDAGSAAPRRQRRAGGFTLVELLGALAVSSLLMMMVMTVIGHIGRARRSIETLDIDPAPDLLVQMLRRDLTHAQRIAITSGQVVLEGPCALAPATLGASHDPVRVTYRLREAAGGRWLLRLQTDLNEPAIVPAWAELVCGGVSSFQVKLVEDEGMPSSATAPGEMRPLPQRIQVLVQWNDGRPPTSELVFTR